MALGCVQLPDGRYAIDDITVRGNDTIDDAEIEESIATRPSPRFLGLIAGLIYDHEVFDRYVLERDLQRIERYYRARGFYWARVRAGRVFNVGRQKVRVEIQIEEGPPTLIQRVDVHGVQTLPQEVRSEVEDDVNNTLPLGERFEEAALEEATEELERSLEDQGHAHVRISRGADVDATRHRVSVGLWVEPGPVVKLGAIHIKGLGSIPESEVRQTMSLAPGSLYSRGELEAAERALLDLGVFSAASVKPRLDHDPNTPPPNVVPIDVTLQTSRFRSVHLGGGVQVDSQRTDVHLVAGWEDRNFLGGLRNFLVEFVPGAVIHPTRLPEIETPERLLPQARVRLELRQPALFEALTYGVVRTQASVAPVLLTSRPDPAAPILGYRDLRASAGLERVLYWKLYGSVSHNVQINDPFTYTGALDPALDTALVSYPELLVRLEARDDRLAPTEGVYASANLQVAGVGGDARDIKLQPEARGYLPAGRGIVLAGRASLGLLFAENYGDTVAPNAFTGDPGTDRGTWVRDIQLMYLRGFFAGGPGSNRGYALREIGPHGAVPFYNPGQSTEEFSGACEVESAMGPLSPNCKLPLGGFTLWEASFEVRFPIYGPLRGALFTDIADVSPYRLDFRWDRPHLSAGLGLRFGTPIGPVRLDAGYRVPGLQAPASSDESVPGTLLGLPIAISLGIGEPF